MKKFKLILLLTIVFSSNYVIAQFDTNYVYLTKDRFIVTPIFEFYKTTFKIFENKNSDIKVSKDYVERSFSTKNNLYLGFGLSFYRLGFSVSFLLPHSNIPELKKSKSISFVGGYSLKKLYGEVRLREYEAFQEQVITYKDDSISSVLTINSDNDYFQLGGALYYFTADKFNYDANFKNYNIQKKSAISPLIFTNINYYKIRANLTLEDSTVKTPAIETAKIISAKFGGGLSAVYVYKSLYIALLGNVGVSFKDNQVSNNFFFDSSNSVHPYFEFKTSLGYNSNKYIAAFTFSYDNDFIYLKPNKVGLNNFYMNFKIGYKFDSKYLGKAAKFL